MSGMPPCHNSVHKDSRGGCYKRYRENLSKLFDESGKMKSGDICDKFVFASDDKHCEPGKISKEEIQEYIQTKNIPGNIHIIELQRWGREYEV